MKLLKMLTETPGVPGREERIREVIRKEVEGDFDEIRTDDMGNLICLRKAGKHVRGRTPKSVMIAAHMDEIGFYVKHVNEETGIIRLQNVGGFDTRNLFARRVVVHGKKDLLGVLSPPPKPVHIAGQEELKKVYKVGELYVDMLRDGKQVARQVAIGDPVTLVQTTEEIGNCWTGKAMDDRAGVWVAINAVRKVGNKSPYDIYCVASTQEEVGLRGAATSSYGINPDFGIALDVTLACDTPAKNGPDTITELGKGVAIKIMDSSSISHRGLVDEMIAVAKRKKIPYQLEILPAGGTDAGMLQRARAGRPTITLSVPTRYVHSIVETVHKKDMKATVDLLAGWLAG